jgi:penicillin V acylase-like amidase (Ntn superfamily)
MNQYSKWMVTLFSSTKLNIKIITVVILVLLIIPNSVFACSAFLFKGDKYQIIGFNENWKHLPGMVVVNKRGIVKYNLSWADLVAVQPAAPKMSWKTKYGSITFNAFGIDAPCYGMNESGLFLVELFLDKTYSPPDTSRPRMFWAQWIQYQLDNYATVEEVVQQLPEAPLIDWWPHFPGSHFFVTDASGSTAAIEFIEGKPVVSIAERMPLPILCNGPYQSELVALGRFKAFGGERPFDYATKSWDLRFARIAHRLNEYRSEMTPPLELAWKLLDEVYAGTWQLVADARNRILYFRSQASSNIKSINLADCDFSTDSPIHFIDLHINFNGDVAPQLATWTPEINQAYVLTGFPAGYEQEAFYRSEDYRNLQKNLLNYSEQLQRQIKILRTMNDHSSTNRLSDFPILKGSYLGQQPPGLKAEPFAPAVLSAPGKNHHTLSFSTDGKELYFSRYPEYVTMMMRQVDGIWQSPISTPVTGWEAIFTSASVSPMDLSGYPSISDRMSTRVISTCAPSFHPMGSISSSHGSARTATENQREYRTG